MNAASVSTENQRRLGQRASRKRGHVVTSQPQQRRLTDQEIAQRLAALQPLPTFPGEREWVDRLRSVEDFIALGPLVASDFRRIAQVDPREFDRRRAMCPALFALLFDAFPPAP